MGAKRSSVATPLLALVAVAFSLALAEGIVRAAGLGRTFLTRGGLHEYDPLAGWRCRSGLDASYVLPRSFDVRIRCNGDGLRGSEVPRAKPAGRTRVAVLGDSFMWGFGVEDDEVFAHVLAKELGNGDSVNLGANGYSTVQSLVRLESQGLAYDPDWAVVAFYWNDLEDNFDDKDGGRPIARIGDAGALHVDNSPVRRRWKSGPKQWLRHHSRLFGFLEYSFKLVGETWQHWIEPDEIGPEDFLPEAFDPGEIAFAERDVYAPPSAALDHAWEAVRLALARIDARQRERGGRTLVMFVPSRYAATQERFRELFGDDPSLDRERPARRLGEIAREEGIAYLNLAPVFRSAPDPFALFLPEDAHWNAAGHALAAREAAVRIRAASTEAAASEPGSENRIRAR